MSVTTETNIRDLAAQLARSFQTFDHEGQDFTKLTDDAPEWAQDVVREAHGEFLPDDWRYVAIRMAAYHIADMDEDADVVEEAHSFADSNIDTYNGERTAWLASNVNRAWYVDEGVQEHGHSDDGILGDIAVGQYVEGLEIFHQLVEALEKVEA